MSENSLNREGAKDAKKGAMRFKAVQAMPLAPGKTTTSYSSAPFAPLRFELYD